MATGVPFSVAISSAAREAGMPSAADRVDETLDAPGSGAVRETAHPNSGRGPDRRAGARPVPRMVGGDGFGWQSGGMVPLELFDAGVPCVRSVARPLKTAGTFYWNCLTPASCIRSAFPVR